MFAAAKRTLIPLAVALFLGARSVIADVGEPTGSFTITVKQGTTTLANKFVTVGPGQDLQDLKATFQDGDPEDFTQIGTIGTTTPSPIILKVVTEDDPTFRLLHMYIDVPVSLMNINSPGPTSLFDPSSLSLVDVSIQNMTFTGTTFATPQLRNLNYFFTSYMRDEAGRFYNLPQSQACGAFGNGVIDIQVPGTAYLDGTPNPYAFSATPGAAVSWSWSNIDNPLVGTPVNNGTYAFCGPYTGGSGYVFELGLAVGFAGVPEPTTLMLLLASAVLLIHRPHPHRHSDASR